MATRLWLAMWAMCLALASDAGAQYKPTELEQRNEAVIRQHHDATNRGDIVTAAQQRPKCLRCRSRNFSAAQG